MRGFTARQGLSLGWLLGLAMLASCGTNSAGTTVESAASESTLPTTSSKLALSESTLPTTSVAASIEPTVRLPPVELIAIDLQCPSSTAPTLMDREVTVAETEWAEEIGPMMGWSPELALRRTRFEEFLDSSLMSVLYESPRFAGAVIEPTDDYLGYTILKGVEAPSGEFTEVFCQLPELQVRVGADSSTIDLSEAIDLLFDEYPGADGLVVGAGTDTQANGISLNATDVEAAEQLAVEFERDTGVRVTSIIYQAPTRSVRRVVNITEAELEADGKTLLVTSGTCRGGLAAAVVEYDDRVEIEVESIVQLGGGPRLLCAAVRIELDTVLGDRTLVNASGGSIRVVELPE